MPPSAEELTPRVARTGTASEIDSRSFRIVPAAIIGACLFSMYRDALFQDYFFADDVHLYPEYFFKGTSLSRYLKYGRPVTDFLQNLSSATGFLSDTAQFARLLSLLLLGWLLYLIYLSLSRAWDRWLALATAIAIGCLPAFQIHVTYARIFTYTLGYILCYYAIEAIYKPKPQKQDWIVFSILILLGYHMFQSVPFFALVFILIKIISGEPIERIGQLKRATLAVLSLAALVVVSAAIYKALVSLTGFAGFYHKASVPLEFLGGDVAVLSRVPFADGLNVFEIWSYLWPIPALSGPSRNSVYGAAALGFAALLVLRYIVGGRTRNDAIVIGVGVLFFFAAMLPVAMGGFDQRQHLYAAPQSLLVVMLVWSLVGLKVPRPAIAAGIGLAVVAVAVSFPRKLVFPEAFSVEYVTRAIADQPKSGPGLRIAVVKREVGASCRYEPCTGFFRRSHASIVRVPFLYEKVAKRKHRKVESVKLVGSRKLDATISRNSGKEGFLVVDFDNVAAEYATHYKY